MSATAEANKDLIRRLMAEVDRGDDNVVDTYYSPDYVDHAPSPVRRQAAGRDGLRHAFAVFRRAFPDTRHTIDDLIAEGDRVVARISALATQTGDLYGHAPTGRVVNLTSIVIYRIVDGRIAERWAYEGPGVLEQLGIAPPFSHAEDARERPKGNWQSSLSEEATMDVKTAVKEKYGAAARMAAEGQRAACGPSAGTGCCDPITTNLYGADETGQVPEAAMRASLGCGNPTALADLREGEVVLDLGSGGGIDVLLSARRVGPTGKAYGLDATDEMVALAETNKRESGLTNVEFLRGDIEQIPLPDASVDVVISNCVINLSADKDRVLREAFRVLKPGGRFAVSDVVTKGELPPALRRSMEAWVGCVAGALSETEYRDKLTAVGFEKVDVEVTRVYGVEEARSFLAGEGLDVDALVEQTRANVVSAFVRAAKPKSCCGPSCCA